MEVGMTDVGVELVGMQRQVDMRDRASLILMLVAMRVVMRVAVTVACRSCTASAWSL